MKPNQFLIALLFGSFLSSNLWGRDLLSGLDLTTQEIKDLKACVCESSNGQFNGKTKDLKNQDINIISNTLLINDAEVLQSLESFGSDSLNFETVLNKMTGNAPNAVVQLASEVNKAPNIGLPTEEVVDPIFSNLVLDLSGWKLHNVVFRPDLGTSDRFGEARLIFKSKNPATLARIIFEYKLPKAILQGSNGITIADNEWAAMFAGIACLKKNNKVQYISALKKLLNRVVTSKYSGLPCGSAIGQIRVNILSNGVWKLFEYKLVGCNLKRNQMELTPPDNFYQEQGQSIRSGNQSFSANELFKNDLVLYLKGFISSPVFQKASMNTDFGSSSWMKGVTGTPGSSCPSLCTSNATTPGCNCEYINHLKSNGIIITHPLVLKKSKDFSLATCNSCHSNCSTSEGCGGVSFFHTNEDGSPGKFLSTDNGEVDVDGKPVGDLVQRFKKTNDLLIQPGDLNNPHLSGICNVSKNCNFDYVENNVFDLQDLEHLKSVVTGKVVAMKGKTYDLDGDGFSNTSDFSSATLFLKGKISAGEAFKNPTCDTLSPEFNHKLTICERVKLFGDANNNGVVSTADLLILTKIILGVITTPDKLLFDVNGDGKLSTQDVLIIQNFILGKLDCSSSSGSTQQRSRKNIEADECEVIKTIDSNRNKILEVSELRKVNAPILNLADLDRSGNLTSGEHGFIGDIARRCEWFKSVDAKILLDNPDPVVIFKRP